MTLNSSFGRLRCLDSGIVGYCDAIGICTGSSATPASGHYTSQLVKYLIIAQICVWRVTGRWV